MFYLQIHIVYRIHLYT